MVPCRHWQVRRPQDSRSFSHRSFQLGPIQSSSTAVHDDTFPPSISKFLQTFLLNRALCIADHMTCDKYIHSHTWPLFTTQRQRQQISSTTSINNNSHSHLRIYMNPSIHWVLVLPRLIYAFSDLPMLCRGCPFNSKPSLKFAMFLPWW